jgi:hypothetical protein
MEQTRAPEQRRAEPTKRMRPSNSQLDQRPDINARSRAEVLSTSLAATLSEKFAATARAADFAQINKVCFPIIVPLFDMECLQFLV